MALVFPSRPFRVHGGVRVPHRKNTKHKKTAEMPIPAQVTLPMLQHIGAPCTPLVKKGDHVYAGQKIADSEAYVSVPIHASVSGTIAGIVPMTLTSGQVVDAVVIDSDGRMEYDPELTVPPPVTNREELYQAARNAGLVGLGGAGFPAHVKLNVPADKHLDTLIVNVAECEPYVTSDHREALENGKNVLDGIYKIKEILKLKRVIIAVEDNKPDVIAQLREIADNPEMDPLDEVRVLTLKSQYPQGAEKVLVKACTGRAVPVGGLPADVGCIVMNIASISFLASYMRTGKPLTFKRITIDGSAITDPQNVIVPIGTKISEIVKFCGGYKEPAGKLLMGGPMMGIAIISDDMPVIKQNNAILAFTQADAKLLEETDCIRCGKCVKNCPMNLMPTILEKAAQRKDVDTLLQNDVMTCMECGCCSFGCPAGRRLVQAIRLGKYYVKQAEGK